MFHPANLQRRKKYKKNIDTNNSNYFRDNWTDKNGNLIPKHTSKQCKLINNGKFNDLIDGDY